MCHTALFIRTYHIVNIFQISSSAIFKKIAVQFKFAINLQTSSKFHHKFLVIIAQYNATAPLIQSVWVFLLNINFKPKQHPEG